MKITEIVIKLEFIAETVDDLKEEVKRVENVFKDIGYEWSASSSKWSNENKEFYEKVTLVKPHEIKEILKKKDEYEKWKSKGNI